MFDQVQYLQAFDENTSAFANALVAAENSLHHQGQWSAAEIAEHVYIVERSVFAVMLGLTEVKEGAKNYGDDKLKRIIVDMRTRKIVAPQSMSPTGKFGSVQEAAELWLRHRAKCRAYIESGMIVVDERTYEHPFLGLMAISDWLYFILHHTQRHALQLAELQRP
jgi:hypothetical protein